MAASRGIQSSVMNVGQPGQTVLAVAIGDSNLAVIQLKKADIPTVRIAPFSQVLQMLGFSMPQIASRELSPTVSKSNTN